MFKLDEKNIELISNKISIKGNNLNSNNGYGLFICIDFINKDTNEKGYLNINVGYEEQNDITLFENKEYHEDDLSYMLVEVYDTEKFLCLDLTNPIIVKIGTVENNKIKAFIDIDHIGVSDTYYQTLPEDYLIKLTTKLSRCYLEIKEYQAALQLAQRVLSENIKIYGENDISNVEIYDIIYQSEKNLELYSEAIEHLKILNNFYKQIYDEKSDKYMMTNKEIAQLYELNSEIKEAIISYLKYFDLLEDIEFKDKIKEIFETALKIGGLYAKIDEYKEAYDFLKRIDKNYNNGFNRTDKEKYVFQKFICTLASYLNNNNVYLQELLFLEKILVDSKKVKLPILGRNYINIAHIYKIKKDLDKSIQYYTKALNIFKTESDGKLLNEINEAIKAIQKEKRNNEISKI